MIDPYDEDELVLEEPDELEDDEGGCEDDSTSRSLDGISNRGHQIVQFLDSQHSNVANRIREPGKSFREVDRGEDASDRVDSVSSEICTPLLPLEPVFLKDLPDFEIRVIVRISVMLS
jgi:hypothetical protein